MKNGLKCNPRSSFHNTLIYFIFFLIIDCGYSQYSNPVKHPIRLGGSFGELRASHFHAGIDIKPKYQGAETDTIYAIADGYIKRIKVSRGGFGRVMYIDHPKTGHTSVYAHLKMFIGNTSKQVEREQLKNENYEIELFPNQNEILIKKGQAIGIMGNSGSSYGSHLHFEIRDIVTEHTLNPFHFGIKAYDIIKPTISNIGVHGLSPNYHEVDYKILSNSLWQAGIEPTVTLSAWKVGIGVQGFDQMNGADNKNGIYEYKLLIDDSLNFHAIMDNVDYDNGHVINAYIDYPTKKKEGRTEALLYTLPTNNFKTIKYVKNDGAFEIYEQKSRRVCIEVSDFEGNKTKKCFNILRDKAMGVKTPIMRYDEYVSTGENKTIQVGEVSLSIPKGAFARDQFLKIDYQGPNCYIIGDSNEAILRDLKLCVPIALSNAKMNLVKVSTDGSKSTKGGDISGNEICSRIGEFGKYCIEVDDIDPTISFSSLKIKKGMDLKITVNDNISYQSPARGITYKVFINNEFVPCEYKEVAKTIYIKTDKLAKGNHNIKIEASDFRRNQVSTIKQISVY